MRHSDAERAGRQHSYLASPCFAPSRRAPARRGIPIRPFIAIAALAATGSIAAATLAWAHSWYPIECCSGQDCRKVDTMEHLPDGTLRMLFSGQEVIVPKGFRQMPSQDMDAHVCVYRNAAGRWAPRCVFVPAGA